METLHCNNNFNSHTSTVIPMAYSEMPKQPMLQQSISESWVSWFSTHWANTLPLSLWGHECSYMGPLINDSNDGVSPFHKANLYFQRNVTFGVCSGPSLPPVFGMHIQRGRSGRSCHVQWCVVRAQSFWADTWRVMANRESWDPFL